ncbi:MAG: helix-turn-helix domain-containing protein [Trebonia sp.]
MKPDENALRGRVRQVIKETGLTGIEFADDVELDADKLSKSLTGVRRFTSYELALIAERGRTTVDWLLTGTPPERIAVAARAQARTADSPLDEAMDRAREVAEVHEILRRVAPTPDDALPGLPDTFITGYAIGDGPRLADEALKILQSDGCSSEDLRMDPASAIEHGFGINVLIEGFGDGFDGLACSTSTFRLIIVNSRTPWSRQRFTLFHEWGHILAGDGKQGGVCVDGDVMGAADRIEEMRANSFAASALMPESDIRDRGQKPVTEARFAELVGYFRVSPDALAWRLKTLGMISPDERAELGAMSVQRAAVLGGWGAEYGKLTRNQGRPRIPVRLAARAAEAFLDGKIAARPLASLLHVDSSTLLEMHGADGDTAADDERAVFIP